MTEQASSLAVLRDDYQTALDRTRRRILTDHGIPDRDEHLSAWPDHPERRRLFIGGSDAPTIIGENPYETNLELWQTKTGQTQPFEGNRLTEWGHRQEPTILEWYADTHPDLLVVPAAGTWRHPDIDFVAASPDAFAWCPDRGLGIVDAKNVGHWSGHQWGGDAPDHFKVQVLHNMGVFGAAWGVLVGLVGGNDPQVYEIGFDADLYRIIRDEEHTFWGHVQAGTPPPIHVAHPNAANALSAFYKADDDLDPVELTDEQIAALETAHDLAAQEKAIKSKLAAAKNTLRLALGSATLGTVDGTPAVTWTETTELDIAAIPDDIAAVYWTATFDTTGFTNDHRALARQHRRPSGQRRLALKPLRTADEEEAA